MREIKMITGFLVATDSSWTGSVRIPKTFEAYRKAIQAGTIEIRKFPINGKSYTFIMDEMGSFVNDRVITALDPRLDIRLFNSILVFKTKGIGYTDLTKEDIENIKNNLFEVDHKGTALKVLGIGI